MRLNELLDAIPLLARNIEHSNEQHDAVAAAVLAGDAAAARDTMAEHVAGTESLLRGFLDENPEPEPRLFRTDHRSSSVSMRIRAFA
jgi:DNA-binding GntR family transcriptional regulator